jgi:hypothetical protein
MRKLMIEDDEAEYLRITNRLSWTVRSALRGCRPSSGWRVPGLGDALWLEIR